MSFSKDVKEELSKAIPGARHCQLAELAAIFSICGRIIIDPKDRHAIKIHTENLAVARKYFHLIRRAFNFNPEVSIRSSVGQKRNKIYTVAVMDQEMARLILTATKFLDAGGQIGEELSIHSNLIIQNACCKRAFLRGAFLASGSISDPEKTYHFEIVIPALTKAIQLKEIIATFSIDAKIIMRKKNYVVYVKEGSQIVDILNVMEAHISLMDLENVRILKEMRNSINRQVNCETANINKTVVAATNQINDILYIKDTMGFGKLTEGLEEIATLRVEYPDASLKELGALLSPPIGKSGVNHRLRKLSILADQLREQKEDISYGNEKNNN